MIRNMIYRTFKVIDVALSCLGIFFALIVLPIAFVVFTANIANGQVTVEQYRAAGNARREAGVKVIGHTWTTWHKWYPDKYYSSLAKELLDGYYLLVAPEGNSITIMDGLSVHLQACKSGSNLILIPGMRVSPDTYTGWTDPKEWESDYAFFTEVRNAFGGKNFYFDQEPYKIKEGKKYPYPDIVYDMTSAMGEWLKIKDCTIHLCPGGADYLQSLVWGTILVRNGNTVYMHDQYTFNRMSGDRSEFIKILKQRKEWCDSLGFVYCPGVYARHLINPDLFKAMSEVGIKEIWCFWQPVPDHYNEFGTEQWKPETAIVQASE